ncbi:MAG: class I SAM-dependent methyltransferase [Verrucomicrobia bacterium]|jgi:predicted methyltransferase|nr:class I SAM-dependent methyltransferase [Verrucomicrobiota bacterium]
MAAEEFLMPCYLDHRDTLISVMNFSPSSRFSLVVGLSIFGAVLVHAQDQKSVNPGINDSFKSIKDDVTPWVERFEREGREVYKHRQRIIDACEIQSGMTVADIGAGTGLFTSLLAKATAPKGSVYAVDIVPPFIANIARRMAEAKISNVTPVLCTDKSTNLPAGSVDKVFICDTYHHFEFPTSTLASIREALRPGGEILLVEFHRIPGKSSDFILNHVRAGQEVFMKEIEAAGFESLGEVKGFLNDNYLIRFRKKE